MSILPRVEARTERSSRQGADQLENLLKRYPAPAVTVTCSTNTLSVHAPPPHVLSLLAGVLVSCGRGCGKLVQLDNDDKRIRHTTGNCQGYILLSASRLIIKNDTSWCPCQTSHSTSNTSRGQGSRHLMRQILDSDPNDPWQGQYDVLYPSQRFIY